MEVGYILTATIFFLSLSSFILFSYALKERKVKLLPFGELLLYLSASISVSALLLLAYYFITDNFSIIYVYSNSDKNMPVIFKLSAVWAGKEGSLLLWTAFSLLIASVFTVKSEKDERALKAVVVLTLISSFVAGLTFASSNPFLTLPFKPQDGVGMNPLLRTVEMILHPPVVFLAYSLTAIPYAMSIAGYGGYKKWVSMAWISLTIGIILGCWWAYRTLGWGGFWGWDPVENSSLLPWLALTASYHARGKMKEYLIHLSFLFVIFAAFMTRSGVVKSVHAFAYELTGWSYALFFLVFALISFHILNSREGKLELGESRRFYATLLLILSILTVFAGTFSSIFFSLDRFYYTLTFTPIFAAISVLIAVELPRFKSKSKLLIHAAILILFIGSMAVWNFEKRFESVELAPSGEVAEWKLKLKDISSYEDREKFTITAAVEVSDGLKKVFHPELYIYKIERDQRVVSGIDVFTSPVYDYYMALREVKRDSAVVDFYIVPLINLVWLSFALLVVSSSRLLIEGQRF